MIRFTLNKGSEMSLFPRNQIMQHQRIHHRKNVQYVYEPGTVVGMSSFNQDYTYVDIDHRGKQYTALLFGPFTVEHIEDTQEEEE